jgi:hypothetical protein
MSWMDPAQVPPPPDTPADILRKAPRYLQVLVLLLGGVWVVEVAAMLASQSFNLLGWVIDIPVLTLLTIPIARKIAKTDRDPEQVWFVMAAFAAKMLGSLIRYYFTYIAYVSAGDAEEYNGWGKYLAPYYRSFNFNPPQKTGPIPGTGFLEKGTGYLYAVVGTSKLGAFAIFAWLGFIGLLLCWRAFCRAVPTGNHRAYGLLVLFLPSLLYWTSALGKDAWAVMGLGMCSFGVALFMTRKPIQALLFLAAGLTALVMIRPHVALTVFAGLVLAALLFKPSKVSPLNPIVRVVTFGLLFVMMLVLIQQTQQFLGVDTLNQETVNSSLSNAEGRTSEAGSNFTPVTVNSPIDFPYAFLTVLFRPWPFESGNGQSLATSAEGVFLLWYIFRHRRRLLSLPRSLRRESYTAYCLGIVITFVYGFSAFSNFGILARERCQVMPFFLALLCLAEKKKKKEEREELSASIDDLRRQPENPYARFGPADGEPRTEADHASGSAPQGSGGPPNA